MTHPSESTNGRELPGQTCSARGHLLAAMACPSSQEVRSHTLQVARFCGWIVADGPTSARVRVSVGGREPFVVPVSTPRADVVRVLGESHGVRDAYDFAFYVDLPENLRERLPVTLELSDGVNPPSVLPYFLVPDIDVLALDTFVVDPNLMLSLARRHLRGMGLEFGALHLPLPVDPTTTRMQYADRFSREGAMATYPEMREPYGAMMVEVDFLIDMDRAPLTSLPPFDFYVANGVLEHLVNPLWFLERLHGVMRPRARLLLTLPDRDYTFDTRRALTPHEHLFAECESRETELSDAHLEDALTHTLPVPIPTDPALRAALFEFHRGRSIHVHVWNQRSFDELLPLAMSRLGLRFDVVERIPSRDAGGNIVYVLERRQ